MSNFLNSLEFSLEVGYVMLQNGYTVQQAYDEGIALCDLTEKEKEKLMERLKVFKV